jgi:hypothetical protein
MYLHWQRKVVSVDPLHWYSTTILIQYLQAVSDYITNAGEDAHIAASIPQLARIHIPAGRRVRFPEEGRYICESFGGFNVELFRLSLALNVMANVKKIPREYPHYKTIGEAEVYALDRIDHMLVVIALEANQVNIFQRRNFEKRHNIVWEENAA